MTTAQAQAQAQAVHTATPAATLGYTGLTRGQIRWASEFDWFVDWYARDGILCVLARTVDSDYNIKIQEFSCFESLRAWAGY